MSDPPAGDTQSDSDPWKDVEIVTPILGSRDLSELKISLINSCKIIEESDLRFLDELEGSPHVDARQWALARTHIQTGYMWLVRSIAQPMRLKDVQFQEKEEKPNAV